MSSLKLPVRSTAEEYRALLAGKDSKRIAYATALHATNRSVTITHHDSSIFQLYDDGAISFTSAGWISATTTDRLHRLLKAANPRLGLNRERGSLYLHIDVSSPPYECGGITYQLDRYKGHRLELSPESRYTVTQSAGIITVTAHSKSAKYYDAGHQAYQFQTH